jgi:hypothetical protein
MTDRGGGAMRKLLAKIEALMAAAAFAEEGEVETARQIAAEAGVDGSHDGHGEAGTPSTSKPSPEEPLGMRVVRT